MNRVKFPKRVMPIKDPARMASKNVKISIRFGGHTRGARDQ